MLRAVFNAMDADKDGCVVPSEFVKAEFQEVQFMFSFIDQNSDGSLSFEEWCSGIESFNWSDEEFDREMKRALEALRTHDRQAAAVASSAAPEPSQASSARVPMLEKVFRVMDVDGNGHIDLAEFVLMSHHFGDRDVSKTIFSFMDADGDGKLSLKEWMAGAESLSLSDADFEREMNHILGAREALSEARLHIGEWGRKVFLQFDANGDGMLSAVELAAALKSLPMIETSAQPPKGSPLMTVEESECHAADARLPMHDCARLPTMHDCAHATTNAHVRCVEHGNI